MGWREGERAGRKTETEGRTELGRGRENRGTVGHLRRAGLVWVGEITDGSPSPWVNY